jgi:hypothetical protein
MGHRRAPLYPDQRGSSKIAPHASRNGSARRNQLSDLKDKLKDKIDAVADAAKDTTDKAVDTGKDVAHTAGKKLEQGSKKLKDA